MAEGNSNICNIGEFLTQGLAIGDAAASQDLTTHIPSDTERPPDRCSLVLPWIIDR